VTDGGSAWEVWIDTAVSLRKEVQREGASSIGSDRLDNSLPTWALFLGTRVFRGRAAGVQADKTMTSFLRKSQRSSLESVIQRIQRALQDKDDKEHEIDSLWGLQEKYIEHYYNCDKNPRHCCVSHQNHAKYDVFISHRGGSGSTKQRAVQLRQLLDKLSIKAFVDITDLSPSSNQSKDAQGKIFCTLYHCDVVLVLMEKAYFESAYCMAEFKAAHDSEKKVVTILMEAFAHFSALPRPERCLLSEEEFEKWHDRATQDTIPFNYSQDVDPNLSEMVATSTWNFVRGDDGTFIPYRRLNEMIRDNRDSPVVKQYLRLVGGNVGQAASLFSFNPSRDAAAKLANFDPVFREWVFERVQMWSIATLWTRAFVLKGAAGMGKSVISAQLFTKAYGELGSGPTNRTSHSSSRLTKALNRFTLSKENVKVVIGAAHFFNYAVEDTSNLFKLFQSIAHQLSKHVPGLTDVVGAR